jgi:hypothetical protein
MRQGENEKMLDTFEHVEQIASREADAHEGNFWGYSDLIVSSYAIGKHEEARRALPVAIAIAPIDSPFMLEGLVETLREVIEHVPQAHCPPIEEAIEILDEEMERRSNQVRRLEDLPTSGDGVAAEETTS